MDIYWFFHPHHNPRLHNTPLRQQELGELEQAGAELLKSIMRAKHRTERNPVDPIEASHFDEVILAARFIVDSLKRLADAHPGDDKFALIDLMKERSKFSGWEAWSTLVKEQVSKTEE